MRKIIIALAALAAFGLALPAFSSAKADEAKIVIGTGDHDGDHYRRHHHHHHKVIVIEKDHDHHD
jgi:hypothetical protein